MTNWLGLIIGAVLGWMLGGPFGAFIGALLGQSVSIGVSRGGWNAHDALRAQEAFFTATFSVMGHIAKADGVVSADEIQAARAVMAHMNLNPDQQRAAIELFNRGKQPDFDLDAALAQFRAACFGRHDLMRMFLQIQLHAALADGRLHPAERAMFERICALLGISEFELRQYEQFINAQRRYQGAHTGAGLRMAREDVLATAYQTLGVSPQASDADIKTAYRRLMKENHPDKLVARGLPEAMLKLAQEKVQQINVAYDTVKEARGIK